MFLLHRNKIMFNIKAARQLIHLKDIITVHNYEIHSTNNHKIIKK